MATAIMMATTIITKVRVGIGLSVVQGAESLVGGY